MVASVLPDPDAPFGARVRQRLTTEQVIWFTTVADDGTPQPNPVWFLWEDDQILIYNRRDARRLSHLRDRPRVALNFDSDGRGGDIVVPSGRAEFDDHAPPPHEMPAYLNKYREGMARVTGSPEAFSTAYPIAVRVRLTHVRGY